MAETSLSINSVKHRWWTHWTNWSLNLIHDVASINALSNYCFLKLLNTVQYIYQFVHPSVWCEASPSSSLRTITMIHKKKLFSKAATMQEFPLRLMRKVSVCKEKSWTEILIADSIANVNQNKFSTARSVLSDFLCKMAHLLSGIKNVLTWNKVPLDFHYLAHAIVCRDAIKD